ncbi:MAG: RpoL/Rpb11 RNA polymerase subunit family protein [Candidatus Methanomethylicaceae archaeon]|nr:RpoL/Rpb11 RNA polymerase subunit family protein [Candidatus Verstraetearchaeota archaeon]
MIKIIKNNENWLEIELPNEDHTIGNLLKSILLMDEHVKQAGYRVIHPIIGGIRIVIQTDGKEKPKDALINALLKIEKDTQELKEKIINILKENKS